MYILEKTEKGWSCTDNETLFNIQWEDHKFNDVNTQKIGFIDKEPDDAGKIAKMATAMADWLSAFHYNKICEPVSPRLRIGHAIEVIRKQKKLTQQELADRTELQRSTIDRIEKGKFNVSIDLLNTIAEALNLEITIAEI